MHVHYHKLFCAKLFFFGYFFITREIVCEVGLCIHLAFKQIKYGKPSGKKVSKILVNANLKHLTFNFLDIGTKSSTSIKLNLTAVTCCSLNF